MKFKEIKEHKKQYLFLLLLADEQEDMIDRYLERGRMYLLEDHEVKGECVVTDEGNGVLEIKNIAVAPEFQRAVMESIDSFHRKKNIKPSILFYK